MELQQKYSYRFVNYRELTENEKRQVWIIRNLPDIRIWMANPDLTKWSQHLHFLDSLINRPYINHYLVYDKFNNIIGSVNFTIIKKGIAE